MSNRRLFLLCAAVVALLVFTDGRGFWLVLIVTLMAPLAIDLYREWRRDTADLRSLRRNQTLRKGQR